MLADLIPPGGSLTWLDDSVGTDQMTGRLTWFPVSRAL